jgi:hypothetical protein
MSGPRALAARLARWFLVAAFVGPGRPFRPRISCAIDLLTLHLERGATDA